MKYKEMYILKRKSIKYRTVCLGSMGIELCNVNKLENLQKGYSVGPEGESLTGNAKGDWKQSWLVIGNDDICGDPVFIDADVEMLPVFTCMHGTEGWEVKQIANSFDSFMKSLDHVKKVSKGRTNPIDIEEKPLTNEEIQSTLTMIARENPGLELNFWKSWLYQFED